MDRHGAGRGAWLCRDSIGCLDDAVRRHADLFYHVIIGRGVGFSKPDRAGQEDFSEMPEHVGIGF